MSVDQKDISSLSEEELSDLKEQTSRAVDNECAKRELLKQLDSKTKTMVGLVRENNNLITSIKKSLSNL